MHRRTNNFEALVAAVVRKSEMVEDTEDQKELLLYAANIRESVMEDPQGAIDLYQQVLTIDDSERRALEALVKLYIQLENWEKLKDVYQRQSELAEDHDERRRALFVLGQVYDTELQDIDRAIDTYQQILDDWGITEGAITDPRILTRKNIPEPTPLYSTQEPTPTPSL